MDGRLRAPRTFLRWTSPRMDRLASLLAVATRTPTFSVPNALWWPRNSFTNGQGSGLMCIARPALLLWCWTRTKEPDIELKVSACAYIFEPCVDSSYVAANCRRGSCSGPSRLSALINSACHSPYIAALTAQYSRFRILVS